MPRVHRVVRLALLLLAACSTSGAPVAQMPTAKTEIQVTDLEDELQAEASAEARAQWVVARDVLDRRCVVCHSCYDAPCQLKLESHEGLARGASEARVYDPARLSAADPTRLFIDALGVEAWREKDFHAVVPEGADAKARDPRRSVLYRMLALKQAHPLPPMHEGRDASRDVFTFELDRKQVCTDADGFDEFAEQHPYWGMPYAMPALSAAEHQAIVDWLDAGAYYPGEVPLSSQLVREVERWEVLLNQPTAKARLIARYLYEHLFLASLYFEELDETSFFRLVRSRTPIGTPVEEIATRRPFDDPGEGPVYYRFVRRLGTPLAKTHMPYALGGARMARFRELFFDADFEVRMLPSYEPEVIANPFKAFAAIPQKSRYRFLLDDAQLTLMSFIKGPVCRGQVALNVIQERFWVAFIDPDVPWVSDVAQGASMLASEEADMPAEAGSSAWPATWAKYQNEHAVYVRAKNEALRKLAQDGKAGFPLDVIWDGDGGNPNAALTVMRHFDSASVMQGLLGGEPKTMWVMDFPVLERIHYLLVTGFDVFGNVTHQVMTRLYMDFLRMEAEHNFLMFLAPTDRRTVIDAWYRGLDDETKKRVYAELDDSLLPAGVRFASDEPKRELIELFEEKLEPVRSRRYELARVDEIDVQKAARELARLHGAAAAAWPEVTFVAVHEGKRDPEQYLTVLRDHAHTNIADLLGEDDRLMPSDDGLTVLRGLAAAYPNALLQVDRSQLGAFVAQARRLGQGHKPASERALHAFRASYAIERTSPSFWESIDRLHEAAFQESPVEAGLFDLSRFDPPD